MTHYKVHLRYRDELDQRMNYTAWVDADGKQEAAEKGVAELRAERNLPRSIVVTAEPVAQ